MPRSPGSALATVGLAGCFLRGGATTASCPRDRIAALTAQAEVERFATCEAAVGIAIHGSEAIDTSGLRALDRIDGDLVIGPSTSSEEISMTELREVGGAVTVDGNGLLRSVFLPRLAKVGRIEVDGNASLATLSLPSLVTVTGGVAITDNKELALVDMPLLETIGKGLVIEDAPRLTTLVAPGLRAVESVTIAGTPKLSEQVVERLQSRAP